MLQKLKKNEKGFTLVELIVVIAILAVLATLLVPRIMGNVKDSAKQTEISTARTLASEITIWNAKALSSLAATPPATIPADLATRTTNYEVEEDDLTAANGLVLPTGTTTFPKPATVKIIVDLKGNAYIEIQ